MAAAFGAFLDDGRWAPPHVIAEVTDADGEVRCRAEPQARQALDPRDDDGRGRRLVRRRDPSPVDSGLDRHPDSRATVPGPSGGTLAAPLWRDFTARTLPG